MVDETQTKVSGEVSLKLYRGNAIVVAVVHPIRSTTKNGDV